jgi:hypothetical protein
MINNVISILFKNLIKPKSRFLCLLFFPTPPSYPQYALPVPHQPHVEQHSLYGDGLNPRFCAPGLIYYYFIITLEYINFLVIYYKI